MPYILVVCSSRSDNAYFFRFPQPENMKFGKLFDRSPQQTLEKDVFAMACIRRVNLDACWSRASSIVQANTYKVREGLNISVGMGMKGPYLNPGPLPSHDHCGYEVASDSDGGRVVKSGPVFQLAQTMGDY